MREANCHWPVGWTEKELASGACVTMAGQRCLRPVEMSIDAQELWATFDLVLDARGERTLSSDEVAICAEHQPLWRVWRKVAAERDARAEQVTQLLGAYEDLCKRNQAPVPQKFFSPEVLGRYEARILNAYRNQRGPAERDM